MPLITYAPVIKNNPRSGAGWLAGGGTNYYWGMIGFIDCGEGGGERGMGLGGTRGVRRG